MIYVPDEELTVLLDDMELILLVVTKTEAVATETNQLTLVLVGMVWYAENAPHPVQVLLAFII
jgi:hypothetical protein